jgi:hypothetical protein
MAKAIVGAGLVALGLIWALAVQTVRADQAPSFVRPGSRAADMAACVEPTDFMRRYHMELIKHQRDATVHQGIRGTRYSLAGCIACHASKGPDGHPVAVNAEHQFCNACHAFAAGDVNCFDCHAAIPRGGPLSEAAARLESGRAAGATPANPLGRPVAALVGAGEGQ